jgi:hypothetical protein
VGAKRKPRKALKSRRAYQLPPSNLRTNSNDRKRRRRSQRKTCKMWGLNRSHVHYITKETLQSRLMRPFPPGDSIQASCRLNSAKTPKTKRHGVRRMPHCPGDSKRGQPASYFIPHTKEQFVPNGCCPLTFRYPRNFSPPQTSLPLPGVIGT